MVKRFARSGMVLLLAGVLSSLAPGCRHKVVRPEPPAAGKGGDPAAEAGAHPAEPELVVKKPGKGVALGLADTGIFSDLDSRVSLGLPPCAGDRDLRIEVNKKKRMLTLYLGKVPLKTYPVALGFDPVGDKQKQGDGKTPEGEYTICEMLSENLAARYGARSMRISYPSVKDAQRGLEKGLVTQAQHDAIVEAIEKGEMPPQDTKLGSSIRIHGGGIDGDWTAGCIALRDEDAVEIYGVVGEGTKVVVRSGKKPGKHDADGDGIPDQVDITAGALKCALNGASYDNGYYKIGYPLGDVDRDVGCCADVIVRALRNGGIDLQEEIQEDIAGRPKAYGHVKKPNPDIDHRRVRNLLVYMKKHLEPVEAGLGKVCEWLPGDVVFFDTLPKKGPDHIGILSFAVDENGYPMVVNNWTEGYTTAEMDLLSWVDVTHHFRIR